MNGGLGPAFTHRAVVPCYKGGMVRWVHVRLDTASAAALEVVRAGGMTASDAVRLALLESAARRRVRSAIRNEVRQIAADEPDRMEMRLVREQMAGLAPRLSDR